MAPDNHRLKKSDEKAQWRILEERQSRKRTMADSPAPDFDYWRNIAFVEARAREAARRRSELWEAINKFVSQSGAWVVSLPNHSRLRIEMRRDSNLATKLTDLGYAPRHCGANTRLTSKGILPVDIIEITLEK